MQTTHKFGVKIDLDTTGNSASPDDQNTDQIVLHAFHDWIRFNDSQWFSYNIILTRLSQGGSLEIASGTGQDAASDIINASKTLDDMFERISLHGEQAQSLVKQYIREGKINSLDEDNTDDTNKED